MGLAFLLLSSATGGLFLLAGLRGASWLAIALGPAAGAGISSMVYFLLLWSGAATPAAAWMGQAALSAVAAGLWFRAGHGWAETSAPAASNLALWGLRAAAVLSVALLISDIAATTAATPDGDWDAFAIWNVRARFLASGPDTWQSALGSGPNGALAATGHPAYPLLLSGWIGMAWRAAGAMDTAVPAAAGALFVLSCLGTLFAAVRRVRGEWSAWAALLLLLVTEGFRSQAAAQYADIPLSLLVLGATALLAIAATEDRAQTWVLAGLLAGLTPWTKNEGWPFVLASAAAAAWLGKRRSLLWLAGAAAPVGLTLLLKALAASGSAEPFPTSASEILGRLAEGTRWGTVAGSYAGEIAGMGFLYAHPLLLLALVVWALRLRAKAEWVPLLPLLIPPLALALAAAGVLLVTSADVAWHTSTSVGRLILQPWPAFLFFAFLLLKRPEEHFPPAPAAAAPAAPVDRPGTPPRRPPARRAKG